MDWIQTITIVAANLTVAVISIGITVTLLLRARKEYVEDRRYSENRLRDLHYMCEQTKQEIKQLYMERK